MEKCVVRGFRILLIICSLNISSIFAQDISITINAAQDKKAVSPYIYGKNNTSDFSAQYLKDAGLRFSRMNDGNNATKYNRSKKITSHPDWYNNVYTYDWDAVSQTYSENNPEIQIMWAFQLIGRVASNTENNFDDWAYNESNWWAGCGQNLAGGGKPDEDNPSGDALVEGDYTLYTEEWPADSTVAILNDWFGTNGLGLDKNQFLYWNMDNEPGIWSGTHDDVMPTQLPASDFIDNYIETAKKAKALFPEIKLCGPVATNEWQWFRWGDENIYVDGEYYCWMEYFIKRLAEDEDTSGVRLLDVVDIHFYPDASDDEEALQNHRIFFDEDFAYPDANGIKSITGGWNNDLTNEYIFKRVNDWLTEYYGADHGIKLGLSEWGPSADDPNVCSVVYASLLGTFADNGVEYCSPWNWKIGMWETLHLFSRYSQEYSVSSTSSDDETVSAYTTVNEEVDSMTIIIVNRDIDEEKTISIDISNFSVEDGVYKILQLSKLTSSESFVSHNDNALDKDSVIVSSNTFTVTIPPLSTTAVLISPEGGIVEDKTNECADNVNLKIYPNPATDIVNIAINSTLEALSQITVFNQAGIRVKLLTFDFASQSELSINVSSLPVGLYYISIQNDYFISNRYFTISR